jgi:hypothetical protein
VHLVVAFGLNVTNFFGCELAHADALDSVVEFPMNSTAYGADERAEVEHNRLWPLLSAVQALAVAAHLLHGADAVDEPFLLLCLSHLSILCTSLKIGVLKCAGQRDRRR